MVVQLSSSRGPLLSALGRHPARAPALGFSLSSRAGKVCIIAPRAAHMLSAASLPIIAGLLPSATRAAASSSPAPSLEVAHSGRSALAQALGFSLPSHAGKVRSHAPRAALLLSAASLPAITGVLPLVLRARAAPRQVHTYHSLARPAALNPGATARTPRHLSPHRTRSQPHQSIAELTRLQAAQLQAAAPAKPALRIPLA